MRNKLTIRDMCEISIFTALTCIMAQISIPMPMGVPMTMQTFAITLAAVVLGAQKGAYSSLVYLLLGSVGVPVFSNFTGGVALLVGPTGGFLLSFPLMAYIIGLGAQKHNSKVYFITFLTIGTVINYIVGVLMFCVIMQASLMTGITACVLPFIPTAIIKAVVAGMMGIKIKERLYKTYTPRREQRV